MMPYAAMDSISMDPVDPMGVRQHSEMLGDLSPEAIQTLVEVAGAGSGSPLIVLEIRQLGGALARDAEHLSTMGKGDSKFIMNESRPSRRRWRKGSWLTSPRDRSDASFPDRRHLRQLHGARRRERREGKGRLRARGLRAPRRPQRPLRPTQPLPLQPQHRSLQSGLRKRLRIGAGVHCPRSR